MLEQAPYEVRNWPRRVSSRADSLPLMGSNLYGQGRDMVHALQETPKTWRCLSATAIKLIAIILMTFDHVHQMYAAQGAPLWLTMLGRPVFPLFLFIAADSFHYTRNRTKYLKRLLVASWAMTIITTVTAMLVPNPEIVLMNNAFSTFFVTGLYMQFWDWFRAGIKDKKLSLVMKSILCCFIPVVCALPSLFAGVLSLQGTVPVAVVRAVAFVGLMIPNIMTIEGGFLLVVLGVLFYILREKRWLQVVVLLLFSTMTYVTNDGGIQWMMCAAAIPMLLYNGERGRGLKQLFYVYYPAHIVVLYLCATLMR